MSNNTTRDHSRDRHGLQMLGAAVGILALGPIGAVGLWYAGKKADEWVNANRDRYDPVD